YIGDAVDKPPAAPKWLDRRSAGMPPAGAERTSEHQSQPRKTTDVYSTELYKLQGHSVVSRSGPDAISQNGAVTHDYQEPRSQTAAPAVGVPRSDRCYFKYPSAPTVQPSHVQRANMAQEQEYGSSSGAESDSNAKHGHGSHVNHHCDGGSYAYSQTGTRSGVSYPAARASSAAVFLMVMVKADT